MELRIDGRRQETFNVTTAWQNYFFETDLPVTGDQVRLAFVNNLDGPQDNLRVDYIEIDGLRLQAEDRRTATRVFGRSGFEQTQVLETGGFWNFFNPRITPQQFGRLRYGETATFFTDREGTLTEARLIRLGSVTHSFDMGQRGMTLPIQRTGTTFTVDIPTSREAIPPGHYMLFVVNSAGTPSDGAMVEIF